MEGPSVKALSDKLKPLLEKKKIISVWGNSKKIKYEDILNREIEAVYSFGKNLLIRIKGNGILRIHFLMYGSYSIDQLRKDIKKVRLAIETNENRLYFYNCLAEQINEFIVSNKDILADDWDLEEVLDKLRKREGFICDVLLDQEILPGVGNIIKVESLFRAHIHPESKIENLSKRLLKKLLKEVREFSLLFYELRKENRKLSEHFMVYAKKYCNICKGKIKRKRTGEKKRISYFCEKCQRLY